MTWVLLIKRVSHNFVNGVKGGIYSAFHYADETLQTILCCWRPSLCVKGYSYANYVCTYYRDVFLVRYQTRFTSTVPSHYALRMCSVHLLTRFCGSLWSASISWLVPAVEYAHSMAPLGTVGWHTWMIAVNSFDKSIHWLWVSDEHGLVMNMDRWWTLISGERGSLVNVGHWWRWIAVETFIVKD